VHHASQRQRLLAGARADAWMLRAIWRRAECGQQHAFIGQLPRADWLAWRQTNATGLELSLRRAQ